MSASHGDCDLYTAMLACMQPPAHVGQEQACHLDAICDDLAAGALGPFDGGDGLDGQGVCQVSSLQDVPQLCVCHAILKCCFSTHLPR